MDLNHYDDRLEKAILSCVLQKPSLINESYLEPKHFLNNDNSKFYKFCQIFYKQTNNLDINLMNTKMKNKDRFLDYYMELINIEPSASLFYNYQEKQEEVYKAYAINQIMISFNNQDLDYEKMMSEINKVNGEFIKTNDKNKLTPEEVVELITTDKSILVFEKFNQLQKKVNFLQNTVNVIAARTSVGKSGLALNLFNDLSENYKCLYFNMEMTEKEVYQRLISMNTNIPIDHFKQPSERQLKLINESARELYKRKIRIVNGSKSIKALKNIIVREQKEEHLIVFIDYIGYVYTKSTHNDRERIGEALRELQILSKDYNVTLFILAQINREGNTEPTLVNLKDSGELEQTAHAVLILHNPTNNLNDENPTLKLMIPKNRNGKTGYLEMKYQKNIQKFEEENYETH